MRKLITLSTLLLMFFAATAVHAQDAGDSKPKDATPADESPKSDKPAAATADETAAVSRQAAAAEFSKLLTGASLVGSFTVDAAGPVDPKQLLKPDRYELATVNKVNGDFWLFVYVHKGVPIPLSMKILWAGKTPVLTLDEFTIAGMGTYSARLMFHGDRYAGTWQHGKSGGLMFGKIETAEFKKERLANPPRRAPLPKQSEPETKQEKKEE
jgi:hypothetical protein